MGFEDAGCGEGWGVVGGGALGVRRFVVGWDVDHGGGAGLDVAVREAGEELGDVPWDGEFDSVGEAGDGAPEPFFPFVVDGDVVAGCSEGGEEVRLGGFVVAEDVHVVGDEQELGVVRAVGVDAGDEGVLPVVALVEGGDVEEGFGEGAGVGDAEEAFVHAEEEAFVVDVRGEVEARDIRW